MSQNALQFCYFSFIGPDAENFLQGQVSINVTKLPVDMFQQTAICDLKGRIHFGLWLQRISSEHLNIVIVADLAEELSAHIKKYAAFSKANLSAASPIYPLIQQEMASFTLDAKLACEICDWETQAIRTGEAWIGKLTAHLFQPQELRLHQRGGVHYDKGCYLGQEIIARLWFKARPKHWLHLIQGQGQAPQVAEHLNRDVQVVNSVAVEAGWLALVSAKPEALAELDVVVLDLPTHLQLDVGRAK